MNIVKESRKNSEVYVAVSTISSSKVRVHIYHCEDFIKMCNTMVMKSSVVGLLRDKEIIALYSSRLMERNYPLLHSSV